MTDPKNTARRFTLKGATPIGEQVVNVANRGDVWGLTLDIGRVTCQQHGGLFEAVSPDGAEIIFSTSDGVEFADFIEARIVDLAWM